MLNIFKGLRRNFVNSGNLKKYLLYAFGEIVLVVAGILIALTVNNWNDERKAKNHLNDIYKLVLIDTQHNIEQCDVIIDHFMAKEQLFMDVINDTLTPALKEADYGANLVAYFLHYDMETKGYEKLKAVNVDDSIAIEILELYASAVLQINLIEESIKENAYNSLSLWRDNYDWFAEFITSQPNADAEEYFINDPQFRNLVAYHHLMVFNNYLRNLRAYKELFIELRDKMVLLEGLDDVIANIEEPFEISEEELNVLAGDYEINEQAGVSVHVVDDHLVVKPTGQDELSFYAESSTKFSAKLVEAAIEFRASESGSYDTLILKNAQADVIAVRK